MIQKLTLYFICLSVAFSLNAKTYTFETVPNDPLKTRIYKLENGLTVFLTQNKTKPRIHSYIATKAGSSYDPADNTGLAHYLEHMLFKGSPKYGTQDWEKEKVYIQAISDLYEKHKAEQNANAKKEIYRQIDSLSYIASGIAIPNEFDKMMAAMGTKGVNAFTSFDQTVYTEDIPSNQIERWAKVESERMSNLVLRIFHTELEAVYEEFNIGQDDDNGKAFDELMNGLFPKHPYGTQTTIGLGSHLKNPSMVAIQKYFKKYYVPNNMAICLSGDLDFDVTMQIIDKYFSGWIKDESLKDMETFAVKSNGVVVKEVVGPKEESVMIGYAFGHANSTDVPMIKLIDAILANQKAGLIDIDIVQQQKALSASCWHYSLKDAGIFVLTGNPKQGQKLEEVKDLLMTEVSKIKAGQFDTTLIEAAKKYLKLRKIKSFEGNSDRAYEYVDAFTKNVAWKDYLDQSIAIDKISKAEIVAFANKFFGGDYTIVYKRTGEAKDIFKVEKPKITPIQTNRDMQSAFLKDVNNTASAPLQPVFIDYKKDIQTNMIGGKVTLNYIKNEVNPTFELYYILDMGSFHNKKLNLATKYLPYLGTDKMSPEQLQMAFFKLGVSMDVFNDEEKTYIKLSGLEESFEAGIKLFEYTLAHAVPNANAYSNMVSDIIKEREDDKLNKQTIFWKKLNGYGAYGPKNPANHILTIDEMKQTKPEELSALIRSLMTFKHKIFYYGTQDISEVTKTISAHHKLGAVLRDYPQPAVYKQLETNKDMVYFVNYDMVQAEIVLMNRGVLFNKDIAPMAKLFNEYFGGGMSSIVFQEIRESKALAYSAFSGYFTPNKKDKYNSMFGYVGTQGDKLKQAVDALRGLMNEIPYSEKAFANAKESVIKSLESDRKSGAEIFWNAEGADRLGLTEDIRKDIYNKVKIATFEDLKAFYNEHIKNKHYTYCIMGNSKKLNLDEIKQYGEFVELDLKTIFGY